MPNVCTCSTTPARVYTDTCDGWRPLACTRAAAKAASRVSYSSENNGAFTPAATHVVPLRLRVTVNKVTAVVFMGILAPQRTRLTIIEECRSTRTQRTRQHQRPARADVFRSRIDLPGRGPGTRRTRRRCRDR